MDVCLSVAARLPNVEFILSSFLEEISSSGYFRRRAWSPNLDSTGGVYSRTSAPNSHLPDGGPKPLCATGRKGSPDGETFKRTDCSFSSRSIVIPFRKG